MTVWKDPETKQMITLHLMNPLLMIFRLLNSGDQVVQKLHFSSEILYASPNKRIFGEFWTGKWFETICKQLPTSNGQVPLPFVLIHEMDETPLSHGGERNFIDFTFEDNMVPFL